jgi:hypothetical protein
MIPVQLTSPDHSPRQAPERSTASIDRHSGGSGILPADEPAIATAQFPPLDPSLVSESIPAFFIGRNKEGFWVARDVRGRTGGIFLLENSALSFARRNSRPAGCATIFPSERFELDLENKGNPFVAHIASLKRLARRGRRRIAVFTGKMKEAVKRRIEDLHVL